MKGKTKGAKGNKERTMEKTKTKSTQNAENSDEKKPSKCDHAQTFKKIADQTHDQ